MFESDKKKKEAGFDTSTPPKASQWIFVGSFDDSQEVWKNKCVLYLPLVMGELRGKTGIRKELWITLSTFTMILW